jgi:hypothetical protein
MFLPSIAAILAASSPSITAKELPVGHEYPVMMEVPHTITNDKGVSVAITIYIRLNSPDMNCTFKDPGLNSAIHWEVVCRQRFLTVEGGHIILTRVRVVDIEIDPINGWAIVSGQDALRLQARFRQKVNVQMDQTRATMSPGI